MWVIVFCAVLVEYVANRYFSRRGVLFPCNILFYMMYVPNTKENIAGKMFTGAILT